MVVVWAYDDKSFFYRKHDSQHRPSKIFQHRLGTSSKEDKLIFEEKSERFTCSISTVVVKIIILLTQVNIQRLRFIIFTKMKKILNQNNYKKGRGYSIHCR